MAFYFTVDERFLDGYLSYDAGAYDAFGYRNDTFVLAEGEWGYGTSLYASYTSDVDVYSLGTLAPGIYRLEVDDWTWDYGNLDYSSIQSVTVLDDAGRVIARRNYDGTIEFEVGLSGGFYAEITGPSYGSAQYRLGYELVSALPIYVTVAASYMLWPSQKNLTLTGYSNIDGTGNALANEITGNFGSNELYGLGGDDRLNGNAGSDRLYGGSGEDQLDGGTGSDWMEGGSGDDIYAVDSSGDIVVESAYGGIDGVLATINYRLDSNVEVLLLGGSSALRGIGNSLANLIGGNGGNNWLEGGLGNDLIKGREGRDILDGGAGSDRMEGGSGNDLYLVDSSGDRVVERSGRGVDTVESRVSFKLGANVENLTLEGYSSIDGVGNGLSNILRGNSGSNALSGGSGNDKIYAGSGDDRVMGGKGRDKMWGESGSDDFVFKSVAEIGLGSRSDVIMDFTRGLDDIDLSRVDANTTRGGNQVFKFLGYESFADKPAQIVVKSGLVRGDVDGDGRADFEIKIANNVHLLESDFVL